MRGNGSGDLSWPMGTLDRVWVFSGRENTGYRGLNVIGALGGFERMGLVAIMTG